MNAHEDEIRKLNQKWRKTEYDRADEFRKADVTLREAMVEQMRCLHNEQRDVGVGRSQYQRDPIIPTIAPSFSTGIVRPQVARISCLHCSASDSMIARFGCDAPRFPK